MTSKNEIIMYFNEQDKECAPEDAIKIVVQKVDENGILQDESVFFKE